MNITVLTLAMTTLLTAGVVTDGIARRLDPCEGVSRAQLDAAVTAMRRDIDRLTTQIVAEERTRQSSEQQGADRLDGSINRLREVESRLQRLEGTLQGLTRYADQIRIALNGVDKLTSTPTVLERAAQRQRAVLVGK